MKARPASRAQCEQIKKSDRGISVSMTYQTQIRKFDQSCVFENLSVLTHSDVFNRITLRAELSYKYHLNGRRKH